MRKRLLIALLASIVIVSCASSRSASFDDARIKEDVVGALHGDHLQGIEVSVTNGHVTLVGLLPSDADRGLATADAERVPGVVAVDNQIAVEHH